MRKLLAAGSAAALIAGMGVLGTPVAHAAPATYTIEVLPGLAGDDYVWAQDLNDAGDVLGTSSDGTRTDAVVWRAATRKTPEVVVKGAAEVAGISGNGVVAGNTMTETTWWRPFISKNGSLSVLQSGQTQETRFVDVSETGTVVDNEGSLWTSITSKTVLPRSGGGLSLSNVETYGISRNGNYVVGATYTASGPTGVRWAGKKLQALGKPSGSTDSGASSVNDRGVSVGGATMKNGSDRSVIWDSNGTPSWLPSAPGLEVQGPTAINNNGVVVGAGRRYEETMAGYDAGLVWSEGKVHNLNDLVDTPAGVTVVAAFDINSAGQITGLVNVPDKSSSYGVTRGFIATPKPFDVYTTPGTHNYNGRVWNTTCEKYSQTTRCRTDIDATQVKVVGGKYVHVKGRAFNNLTYLPSPRSLWKDNPLGRKGAFTKDGRKWKTDCDTAQTGRNGCRSYILASVIRATPKGGGKYTYIVNNEWVFNNIVKFK